MAGKRETKHKVGGSGSGGAKPHASSWMMPAVLLTALVAALWRPLVLQIKPLPVTETETEWSTFDDIWSPEETRQLLRLVKEQQSYYTAVEDITSKIQHIGEATPPVRKVDAQGQEVWECEHPLMAPNKDRSMCILPSRLDIARHYLQTGGISQRREGYESLISRMQVFSGFVFDKLNDPIFDKLFRSESYIQHAVEVCKGKTVFDPIQLGIIISLPGQEVPMHFDVPWFFGATRFDFPQWLVVAMDQSGLWSEQRIPQVQGVAYLHEWVNETTDGGGFFFLPKGPGGHTVVHKSKFNSAIIVDGAVVVHGTTPFNPPGSKPLPYLNKAVRHELRYIPEKDEWHLINSATEAVLETYATTELRISLVWRNRCFETPDEVQRFNETRPMDLNSVLDTFRGELIKRGRLTEQTAQTIAPVDFAQLILDEWARYPFNKNSMMPYNYCVLPRLIRAGWAETLVKFLGCSP